MDGPAAPVGYMERTRLFCRALGYKADYQWARRDVAPFTRRAKPAAQSRIALLTTASPPDGSNKDPKGRRYVWPAPVDPPPEALDTRTLPEIAKPPTRTTGKAPPATLSNTPSCRAWSSPTSASALPPACPGSPRRHRPSSGWRSTCWNRPPQRAARWWRHCLAGRSRLARSLQPGHAGERRRAARPGRRSASQYGRAGTEEGLTLIPTALLIDRCTKARPGLCPGPTKGRRPLETILLSYS